MSVVGIDLGTTNTVVACVRGGKVHVLADEKGTRLLPSVVSFHPNGEVLVGGAAKARRVIDPRNTVYSHKRLIGRSWGSPEIAQARQRFPFDLREGPGQGPLVRARGQDYTLPEISAFVLKRARQIAETALGTPVERAVITVPAHFNELQRASTKVAGRVSGLEVLRILNEPTAAALAYGLGRTGNERVAVYDFGGGTFDCTLLDLNGNVFEVLATAGDSFLGGDDVDNLIADRMAEAFLKAHRQDPKSDPQQLERLKTTAEEMKMALSTAETHTVILKDFGFGTGGSSVHFSFTMTRRDLEAAITPLVDRSFKVTQDALSLARLTPTSFDKVILVGGSTRIPLVRKRVEAFFGAPPMDRVNPDEVVAIGAAIQAAALTEGQRKRSIPAPPGVPGGPPRTVPGVQNEVGDTTHTSELDATNLRPGGTRSGAPSTKGGLPPGVGVPGARPSAALPATGRKVTNPGVAPATQPLGTRASGRPAAPPGTDDDPSIASFPDLSVPTPFEWFPSGSLASGKAPPSAGGAGDAASARTPAVGPEANKPFGSVDDSPSLDSTPDSIRAPNTGTASVGDFGEVRDQSLFSSPGAGVGSLQKTPSTASFGHVSDLSLISSSTATEAMNAITYARKQALEKGQFDRGDDTAATLRKDEDREAGADLPSVVPMADLPSAKGRPMPARKPRSAMTGTAPPPLIAPQPFGPMEKIDAEEDDEPGPASRTAAMPGKPPVPAPSRPPGARPGPPPLQQTALSPQAPPMPPPQPSPRPVSMRPPLPPTMPQAAHQPPPMPTAMSPQLPAPPPPMAAMPPPPMAAMPPPPGGAFHSSPPPAPFGQTAPLGQHAPAAYPSAPPSPFGSAPPPPGLTVSGAQPPIFGAFQSLPPAPLMGGGSGMNMPGFDASQPMAVTAPRGLGYAAPVLVDVTPRGLVVETAGGYTDTIIPRNSKIPCERTRRFATGRDMQTTVRVRVAQGEDQYFPQNTYLGEVELSGLRPAPRGEVVVAVTFECDADGTLRIRARDVQSGQEARATLQLVGVADESSVVMMINRFAQQPVTGGPGQPQ